MIFKFCRLSSVVARTAFAAVCVCGVLSPANALAQHGLLPLSADSVIAESISSTPLDPLAQPAGSTTVNSQTVSATPVSRSRPVVSRSALGRTSSRNGLPAKGTWTLTAEAVFADFDDANGLIGSSTAPQSIGPFSAATFGAIGGDQVGATTLSPQLIGESASDSIGIGWRAALDYRSETNGGFQLEGMMISDGDQSWQRGVGGLNAGADLTTVRVGAALPLDVPGAAGYVIPYDQFFGIQLDTSVDSISAMFAPAGHYYGSIRVQPTWGFRYLRVDQELNLAAAGSGQAWAANADGTRDTTVAATVVSAPYQTLLNSSSETNLFGPVLGVNTTTTGRLIRLNSNLRAGVLLADEDISLAGRGFGRVVDAGFDPLLAFSDSRSGTNGTFLLESQLGVDVHIFQLMNKLKGRNFGSSLVLRLGWSLLYLDQIAKVENSVRWNGFPATPTARRERSDFVLNSFNVGLVLGY